MATPETQNDEVSFTSSAVEQMVNLAMITGNLAEVVEAYGHCRWEGLTEREAAREVIAEFGLRVYPFQILDHHHD